MSSRKIQWFDVEPIDQASQAMLRFYLTQVQQFLEAVRQEKPDRVSIEQFLRGYLAKRPSATLVPNSIYLLSFRLNQTDPPPTRGNRARQAKHQRFVLPVRKGWVKERKEKENNSWDSYRFSTPPTPVDDADNRVVTPDKAETELLEMSLLKWRWGGIKFKGNFHKRLEQQVTEAGRNWNNGDDFLKKVKYLIVQRTAKQKEEAGEAWKVQFVLR